MAEGLHLSPRHREEIEALLREHLPGVEAWAYGNRVNGQGHDDSALDIVLRGPKLAKIDAARLAEFTEALRKSTDRFLGRTARLGPTTGEFPPRNRAGICGVGGERTSPRSRA